MQKRNVLNSPHLLELKKEKRKIFLRKIYIGGFLFVLALALFSYISRIDRLNISDVKVTGNKVVDLKLIKEVVDRETEGEYLWIFPKTNIFFYPKNNIIESLSKDLGRLKDIELSIKNGTILEVTVNERIGKYIWCGDTISESSSEEECYFLDENGLLFDRAPYFSGDVYFRFYGPTDRQLSDAKVGNVKTEVTGTYFRENNFPKFILFKEALEGIGLKPEIFYAENEENAKIILNRGKVLSRGPEVLLKQNLDVSTVVANLKAAIETEPFKTEFKNKYSSLLYLDLRFDNKVYYRFND